jgi:hypothetical protein
MINKYYFDLENLLLCVYELNDRLIQNTKHKKQKKKTQEFL